MGVPPTNPQKFVAAAQRQQARRGSAQAQRRAPSVRQARYNNMSKRRLQQVRSYQQVRRERARQALLSRVLAVIALMLVGVAVATVWHIASTQVFKATGSHASGSGGAQNATTQQADTAAAAETKDVSISLTMVGDILVHQGVWQSGENADGSRNYDHLFANVKEELSSADVGIVNQETILGGDALTISGYPAFNSPQEVGDAEVNAGVDLIAHASNHSMDKGAEGIAADLAFWRTKHPETGVIGISDTAGTPNSTWVYEKDGFKVGFINATFGTNGIPLPANNSDAVRILSYDQLDQDVATLREQKVDAIVCIPHWGEEYHTDVSSYQKDMAAHMAELGVDVVIGAHPHVIQPVETITTDNGHSMLVFWSLGNFVSNSPYASTMVGGMAQVSLTKSADTGKVAVSSYRFTPVVCQRNTGHERTAYKLADYTNELASANGINQGDKSVKFTREWVVDFCQDVLGDDFNRNTCILESNVSG